MQRFLIVFIVLGIGGAGGFLVGRASAPTPQERELEARRTPAATPQPASFQAEETRAEPRGTSKDEPRTESPRVGTARLRVPPPGSTPYG